MMDDYGYEYDWFDYEDQVWFSMSTYGMYDGDYTGMRDII